jgi:hypothetical protein
VSLCLREIGNKRVLYIPKSLEDNFEIGRVYPVIVENKIVGLKCITTAKRKVLYIPSQLEELFYNECYSFAYLKA